MLDGHAGSDLVLRVRGIRVETTEGIEILDNVDFDLRPGVVLGLVGESGCGKTSLALALLGHARPGTRISAGSVVLSGVGDLLALSDQKLRKVRGARIAYVPQDPTSGLNPRRRIGDQIVEVLRVHGTSRPSAVQVARDLANRVGLPSEQGVLNRYPFQLSGGQQQRVAIAMALACDPLVIILDEPTTGLDVTTQARILKLIRELTQKSGAGFLYVTHDLAVVKELADSVAVMYSGRIVEHGSRRAVFSESAHPYTRLLLASVPRLKWKHELTGIAGTAPPPGFRPEGCSFAPRCPLALDVCRTRTPVFERVADGHFSKCFRLGDAASVGDVKRRGPRRELVQTAQILSLESVTASYARGDQSVVTDVSFSLGEGECLALVGESGSGKTTLGRCAVGLHAPDSGSIRYRGQLLAPRTSNRTIEQRRDIQIVFQNPDRSLNPRETVLATIVRVLHFFFNSDRARLEEEAGELIARVRLPKASLHRFPRELSGGERQRLAIARALAARPSVLVCDEITSALDVSIQAAIVELLDELKLGGLSLLFITHNLALVNSIADRVVVLESGVVRESATTEEVIERPTHPYSKSLVTAAPDL